MDGLTKELIEEIFTKLGERFNKLVNDRYTSDEGQRFLMEITGFYHQKEDLQVKQGIVNYLKPALTYLNNENLRKAFESELDYMYLHNESKSILLLHNIPDFHNHWNFEYHMLLGNTGMMKLEVGGAENLNTSAIHYVMEYKAKSEENLRKFNRYIQCYKDLQKYQRYLATRTSTHGSIDTYEIYMKSFVESNRIKDIEDARFN